MKLKLEQLPGHLKQTLAPIYLISSDEPLLQQEAKDTICKAAKAKGFLEHQRLEASTAKFDWEQINISMQNLALFSERTLIDLHLPKPKPGITGSKLLTQYAKCPPKNKVLLITTGKFESATQRAAWLKAIEACGVIIRIWPITPNQLPQWLNQRLQQAGLRIDTHALQLLANSTEGNLLAAAQTIEKLCLQYGNTNKTLNEETVAESLSDNARFDVYQLVETALMGNVVKSVRILSSLQAEATPPTLILWAISRELRRLSQMAQALQQGQLLHQLFREYGVWDKHQAIMRRSLTRHPAPTYWRKLICRAQKIDCLIKGAASGNLWVEFERLLACLQ